MYMIGQLASLENITTKTLRHYEKIGILIPGRYSETGYRLYSEQDRQKLRRIIYYRELGFSLRSIGELLTCDERRKRELIEKHICHIDDSIVKFESLRSELVQIDDKMPAREEMVAVLVIDMQNDFFDGVAFEGERTKRVIAPIKRLIMKARESRIPILYICDRHREEDSELKNWPPHAMEGTTGEQIVKELSPEERDTVFYKSSFNAFSNPELNLFLRRRNVSKLIISGVHTSICINETVMRAHYLGYDIIIPRECVESFTEEEQQFGLQQLRTNYGAVILPLEEVLNII